MRMRQCAKACIALQWVSYFSQQGHPDTVLRASEDELVAQSAKTSHTSVGQLHTLLPDQSPRASTSVKLTLSRKL